jgi:hypothetical protein
VELLIEVIGFLRLNVGAAGGLSYAVGRVEVGSQAYIGVLALRGAKSKVPSSGARHDFMAVMFMILMG